MTSRAREVIKELLAMRRAPKEVGLKLLKVDGDELGMILAPAEPGDTALPDADEPVLIVDREVVSLVHECILDVDGEDEGTPRFALRQVTH
jgi:hypothetical protein